MESRLTTFPQAPRLDVSKVPGVSFRRLNGRMLVTDDWGAHILLSPEDFRRFVSGDFEKGDSLDVALKSQGLHRESLDFGALAKKAQERHLLHWQGPNVHTVVVTLRCNFKCLYCHASVVDPSRTDFDMTVETARRTVDFIFSTPNPELMLEFQGGEPLLNWPVVRFIAAYARQRAEWEGRKLDIGLISNFSLLDENKIRFLAGKGVSFCTSLDGPEDLHNKNRLYLGGNSHAVVRRWLGRLKELRQEGLKIDPTNAICTVTRFSLPHARAIVDQAVELGMERIQLGPLDPIGFARKSWAKIGYGPEEFVAFYREALDHLIELNRKGVRVYEKMALIFLLRILRQEHWRFPNGDGLCRLAYNYDGSIYTSEEGRLVANEGDPTFRIGHIAESGYAEVLDHPMVRASLLAQNLLAQPMCSQCAYKPYCTVVPVANYQTQGSLWGRMPENHWCRTLMGIFDFLFERLEDPDSRKVLESWLEFRSR